MHACKTSLLLSAGFLRNITPEVSNRGSVVIHQASAETNTKSGNTGIFVTITFVLQTGNPDENPNGARFLCRYLSRYLVMLGDTV